VTDAEALALARQRWPGKVIDSARVKADGTVIVCIEESLNKFYTTHELDKDGQPCCHEECKGVSDKTTQNP
jgi:hypothetical protein